MKLEDLGYNDKLEKLRIENNLQDFEIGRVISEHKERYIVKTAKGELESEITGNLRFSSKGREDFPAVGDWVALTIHSTNKGRHVTSHRELIILENGGILVDNPGMREVGIADSTSGLEITFDLIIKHSKNCKFKDCTHTNEKGCSVIEAVEKGEIDEASYENYMKMEREKAHFESSVADRQKKDKDFGKMIKNYKKDINKKKY
ncbi:GTPase RsgA [Proteiniphilum sp. UBA1028]|jgi:ribosome biogenesis GTPase|uniref:GTPase RsgA n=1 Tax=Proteiniphilum sp. UBA1028 TaxID=1947251 RepID=UPI0025FB0B00|nr:GTPase RsgA [Proteiniphilum sp. UBA1028]